MPQANNSAIHPALKNFDDLPETAFIPLTVVCALFACSPATIWRRVKVGQLVAPHRIGARTTRWRVGELRAALMGRI
jgi:predicted DNA-binding transcriptional regulator AlpA